ncbi:5-histidylcysteine sulfoxide synthase [Endozoicomonas euniceicola]|uniref:5-histidylcysteine sulfoxide synthase n=1 Tax=Endozoicomonas euniceicola TaxID=1234143 RepID=A0ABY6GU77_9GAMM|nr:5-histidylcysteine sulfoxide synthase [Endozoicomonas euniceicola]UYM16112.1 5-histidylcysteine sulfoxide synthase [Endozoicomonas euniceicola]
MTVLNFVTADKTLSSRMPLLNTGTPESKRQEILNYFCQTYDVYDRLFEVLDSDEAWYMKAISLRHPLIFYYGHTATFFVNKLIAARLIENRIDPDIEAMMAIGVDEMSWDDLDDKNYDWPAVEALQAYRQKVRAMVCEFIRGMPLEIPVQWDSAAWLILMGIEHERIHLETSSVLIRQLPLSCLNNNGSWPVCNETGAAPENTLVALNGGKLKLGKSYDDPLYGWDNEYGSQEVDVAPFKASEYLVSNGEFLAFLNAGGYDTERWWTDEGWAWATFAKARHPEFWVRKEDCWHYRTLLEEIDMPWNWPVDTNCHEAQAFCRWKSEVTGKSIQLPTEAEWYCLRGQIDTDLPYWEQAPGNINLEYWSSACPVDQFRNGNFCDIIGNVWQWTRTPIDAYEGFRVHPYYDDFSTPTFDSKHNLIKGGCWISTGNYGIKDSRYAFRRHFFQHAGFRYVESTASDQETINPYETDTLVSQYLEFHFGQEYFGVSNYPKRCAELCHRLMGSRPMTRALDLGCSVGRSSFELARWFQHVDGIDFSARFISAAAELQKNGKIRYFTPTEGELGEFKVASLKVMGLDTTDVNRILFTQGDACNLKPKYCDYDLVFAGNLIDRLTEPLVFLGNIHERIRPGGFLVLTSPYTWLEDYTHKDKWLGGIRENGEALDTYSALKRVLSLHFEEVQPPVDIPFVIRETARKYQHTVAHCTVWRCR